MNNFFKIILLSLNLFCINFLCADNQTLKEQILKLDTKDFKNKILFIEEISKNSSDYTLQALKSILKGTLYIRKSDKKIILVDVKNREYFAKGFFDSEKLGILKKRKIIKIKINNKIRNLLSNKIGILQISKGSKTDKIKAIYDIIKDGNLETLKIINNRIVIEKEEAIIEKLKLAKNSIIARYGTNKERILSIRNLSGITNNDIVNILKFIANDKSVDKKVSNEAKKALNLSLKNVKINNIIKTIFLDYHLVQFFY